MKIVSALIISTCLVTSWSALAEEAPQEKPITREARERELSVLSRYARSDEDPLNLRVGNYIVAPSIETGVEYTDNVYYQSNDEQSDFKYFVRPEIEARSTWGMHSLSVGLASEIAVYQDITEENHEDARGWIKGRYDLTGQTSIPVELSYGRSHERRDDPDGRGGIEPVVFHQFNARTGFAHRGHTLGFKIDAGYRDIDYDDTRTATGFINNDDRDREVYTFSGEVGLAHEGYFAPFVYGRYRDTQYNLQTDDAGARRDSEDIEAGIGARLDFSRILRSTFRVGYAERSLENSTFSDFDTLTYNANLIWEPTTLLAFDFGALRFIRETTQTDVSAIVQSELYAAATYELTPAIYLHPKLSYIERDFKGGTEEGLEQYEAEVEMTYEINRNLYAALNYHYTTIQDKGGISQFDDIDVNRVMASLKLEF